MQRIIKFRAWDGDKLIGFGDLMCRQGHFDAFINTIAETTAANNPNGPKYNLMQYTGLKDRNGVEIYEGDIGKIWYVNSRDEPLWCIDSVIFSEGMFHFTSFDTGILDELAIKTVEVIGNIYENPELLGVGE